MLGLRRRRVALASIFLLSVVHADVILFDKGSELVNRQQGGLTA